LDSKTEVDQCTISSAFSQDFVVVSCLQVLIIPIDLWLNLHHKVNLSGTWRHAWTSWQLDRV